MFRFLKRNKSISIPKQVRNITNPKISVIMPVFLGDYEGCAKDRVEKFKLAVITFDRQTYKNKELIIISDGCNIAEEIYNNYLVYENVVFKKIDKQPLFSGNVRNEGLKIASGDIICYLDSDDFIGENHLQVIAQNFSSEPDNDWVYYNDLLFPPSLEVTVREVTVNHGMIGTSSIAHWKDLDASWKDLDGYGHDWEFIQKLISNKTKFKKIYGAEYYVCHIPNIF